MKHFICYHCKLGKQPEDFNKNSKVGRSSWCKQCYANKYANSELGKRRATYPAKVGRPPVHSKVWLGSDGRWWVRTKNGKKRRYVLAMEQHIGNVIPVGYHVHHKDHDKTNDVISNLEILQNGEHSKHHHLGISNKAKGRSGSANHNYRITPDMRSKILELLAAGETQMNIAKKFKIHQTRVSQVKYGK